MTEPQKQLRSDMALYIRFIKCYILVELMPSNCINSFPFKLKAVFFNTLPFLDRSVKNELLNYGPRKAQLSHIFTLVGHTENNKGYFRLKFEEILVLSVIKQEVGDVRDSTYWKLRCLVAFNMNSQEQILPPSLRVNV